MLSAIQSQVTLAVDINQAIQTIKANKWKRILFVPTGALLSKVSFNEGKPVLGIAHAVVIEAVR